MSNKKSVFFLGLCIGVIIAIATPVIAKDFIESTLFPVKISINDEEQLIPDEYVVLNYDDHTYVPLRFIAENLGADVDFDPNQAKVFIDFPKDVSNELIIDSDLLSIAKSGKLKGIDIPLGTLEESMIRKLGEADEEGRTHTSYFIYGDTTFYVWDDQRVRVIDVNFDLSVDEVKQLFGEPVGEGMSDAGTDSYNVIYDAGTKRLFFMFDSKESESGILRFREI